MTARLADHLDVQPKLATGFLRLCCLLAANAKATRGLLAAANDAETFAKTTPAVVRLLDAAAKGLIDLRDIDSLVTKSPVAAGTAADATWAGPLLDYQAVIGQFLELLRPMTVLGRLRTRSMAFSDFSASQTAGVTAGWAGEALPIPLGAAALAPGIRLYPKTLGAMFAMSSDLQRFANRAALAQLQDDLIRACAEAADVSVLDPDFAATTARPASITNGVTPIHSSGTTAAQIYADVEAAVNQLLTAGSTGQNLTVILNPREALHLSTMVGTSSERAFPEMSVTGGSLAGIPAITSASVSDTSSPSEHPIVVVDADRVVVADAGAVVDASSEASLQMDSAPSPSASSTISLWQSNMVALRVRRVLNWQAAVGAVALIDNLAF